MNQTIFLWKVDQATNLLSPVDLPNEIKTLDDVAVALPQGGYTTFRVYPPAKVLNLDAHFSRLEETAKLLNQSVTLDKQLLRHCLREIIAQSPFQNVRIRISIDLATPSQTIYIGLEEVNLPSVENYIEGVDLVTHIGVRNNPKAKATEFIQHAQRIKKEARNHNKVFHEILLVDPDGYIYEGLSSNFYAIKKDTLWTANDGVLSGTTRTILLSLVQQASIPLVLEPVNIKDIPQVTEAFITSVSRGVLPVRRIEHYVIGPGIPGPITLKISDLYKSYIAQAIEDI
ncbi:MAG TPA: aminotransferase class IV [Anaerolineaceae bacterium]